MNTESTTAPKPIFKSKTVLVNAAAAAAVFYPPITAVVQSNPEATIGLFALLNLILRLVTRQKVALFPDAE